MAVEVTWVCGVRMSCRLAGAVLGTAHSQPEIPGAMLVAACSWLSEGGTSVVTFYRLPKWLRSQKCLS